MNSMYSYNDDLVRKLFPMFAMPSIPKSVPIPSLLFSLLVFRTLNMDYYSSSSFDNITESQV